MAEAVSVGSTLQTLGGGLGLGFVLQERAAHDNGQKSAGYVLEQG
jgi:hypothetical protein